MTTPWRMPITIIGFCCSISLSTFTPERSKMTFSKALVFGVAVLVAVVAVISAQDQPTRRCIVYEKSARSRPNNKRVYFEREYPNYEIVSLNNTERDRNTVYWCKQSFPDINDNMVEYTHMEFNATHWWIWKGCSGKFSIEECGTEPITRRPSHTVEGAGMMGAPVVPGVPNLRNPPQDAMNPLFNWLDMNSNLASFNFGNFGPV